MSLPSYAVDFRGKPACPCLAAWLPVYEAELQRRGVLVGPLHIYQLIGDAPASGGVHKDGGAFDLYDLPGDVDVEIARQMGADATWSRKPPTFSPQHNHGVLRGCPHNGPARYQIAAVDEGFNGLGKNGQGGRDDGPRPLSGRTWQEGIEWANEQGDAMKDEDFDRIQAMLDAQRASIVKDIFATAVDKAGTTMKAALRKAAGLVK